jgi:protein-disulfide isomerase
VKPYSFIFTFIAAAILMISQNVWAADAALSAGQVKQVKEVVHDYLVTNPQVLVEASQSLQKQEKEKTAERAKTAIAENAAAIFAAAGNPIAGNPKGDVTLVEFFDYQCPHCKEMHAPIEKLVAADANLRVVYKELPIFGQSSKDASAAALAAMQQGSDKYLKLHNALLAAENPLDKDKVLKIAKTVGLDTDKLAKDMSSDAVQKQIDENFKLAQALNLMGTPTFIISKWQLDNKNNSAKNAAFMPGMPSFEELKAKVDAARK